MTKKNVGKSSVTRDLITRLGCNLLIFPATLALVGLMVSAIYLLVRIYFFGFITVGPMRDPGLLIGIGIFTLGLLALLRVVWANATRLYATFNRYRTMRQEQARIERLMTTDKQPTDNDLSVWLEDESQEKMKR
jgi:hypothetical protein